MIHSVLRHCVVR